MSIVPRAKIRVGLVANLLKSIKKVGLRGKGLISLGQPGPGPRSRGLEDRPFIIVSRTEANDVSSTVTIVPLSSVTGRAADRLVQPLLSAKDTRLPKDSRALCDQVRTIDKERVRGTVGVLSLELLGRIDRGLILHLELEGYVRL